jgi:hypothetical protein
MDITGGSYSHRSFALSAQRTVNFWPQKQTDEKAKSQYILEAFPGKSLFATQSGGVDRGMFAHQGILYKVTGTTLYSVNSAGTHTSLGTIPGTGRCIFAPIGTNLVIEVGTTRYYWNGSVITTISDSDLEAGTGIAHLNNQIIYGGLGGRFGVSDAGDATSINGLNYASAESEADDLVRPYAFNQVLYLMGEETIELWWNSGQGNPPFDRVEGGIVRVGLGAFYSAANDNDNVYFFGDDDQVYAMRGSTSPVVTAISTQPMVHAFKQYGTKSDAIGWTINLDGQWLYVLTFPTEGKTWVYPVGLEWFELSSGADDGRDLANSYAYCFSKHLVADYQNGNIYELDDFSYDDNGDEVIRIRDTAPLHGGLVDAPGKEIEMNRLELIMQTGVGLLSGQGSDPVLMISFCDDGQTFSTEMWVEAGGTGEFRTVEIFNLGKFKTRVMRIRVSDPVYWSIHSAAADLEVCI